MICEYDENYCTVVNYLDIENYVYVMPTGEYH